MSMLNLDPDFDEFCKFVTRNVAYVPIEAYAFHEAASLLEKLSKDVTSFADLQASLAAEESRASGEYLKYEALMVQTLHHRGACRDLSGLVRQFIAAKGKLHRLKCH